MSTDAISWAKETTFGSSSKKLIMMVLADYADADWSTFVGQRRLADETELSERTVRGLLADLEAAGWLERERRQREDGSRTSDRTTLRPHNWLTLGQPADLAGGDTGGQPATDARPTGKRARTLPAMVAGQEEPSEEPSEGTARALRLVDAVEHSVEEAKRAARELAEERFEKWWQAYPKRNGKRVGKAKAKERWMRLSPEEHRAAWIGAHHYATSDWIPKDPERWLRDRCWEDWQTPAEPDRPDRNGAAVTPTMPPAFRFGTQP